MGEEGPEGTRLGQASQLGGGRSNLGPKLHILLWAPLLSVRIPHSAHLRPCSNAHDKGDDDGGQLVLSPCSYTWYSRVPFPLAGSLVGWYPYQLRVTDGPTEVHGIERLPVSHCLHEAGPALAALCCGSVV